MTSPLLTAAARGDDDALALLVRTYHDRVYRFGLRVCRDAFDADDAVQDAFVRLASRPDVVRDQGRPNPKQILDAIDSQRSEPPRTEASR